ncbi:hypothetical protein [Jannaschia seohaensis]|uniref:Uncharacterized protein n=1 Tax=Jannaschia seohaensis TaxID=475081 RepID=A0A2Y9A4T1_9RHOB|nr:hypothetical protein [Jannaschia seohaensis]PWJ22190.1 hypothetical protein BCF38_101600 [Jannaschia seohaensis]SSA38468.1 hypothetical protein SAMN05421539_101600 [Jannaschia seohaensis]
MRFLPVLFLAALAQPATALTCAPPSVASSFAIAQDSPLTYVLAAGRLTPLGGTATPVPRDPPLRVHEVRLARLDGHLASRSGFDRPVSLEIAVELICAGPWCADLPEGELLLFLERHGDDYVLLEGPCPRFALTSTPETRAEALACLTGTCPD